MSCTSEEPLGAAGEGCWKRAELTFQHQLRRHVGDGANGMCLNGFPLGQHAGQPKVGHFGREAPLVIAITCQQDVVAGQVPVQDVQAV